MKRNINVIQSIDGRKNLDNTKWMLPRFFATLRSALSNKTKVVVALLVLLTACDVHEWPENPELVELHLRLNYETEMTKWEHLYDGAEVTEQGYGETYYNHRSHGKIRYIVRTYPVSEKMRTASNYTQEFVFT